MPAKKKPAPKAAKKKTGKKAPKKTGTRHPKAAVAQTIKAGGSTFACYVARVTPNQHSKSKKPKAFCYEV